MVGQLSWSPPQKDIFSLSLSCKFNHWHWHWQAAMISYTLRTTPAEDIMEHAAWYDEEVFKVVMDLLGVPEDHPDANRSTAGGRLVRDRVRLHAGSGGLGITSAAQTAPDARLGSLLLTAHLVAQALGEGFDSTTQGSKALPDLPKLLQAKETVDLKLSKLDGLKVEDAYISPLQHMSKDLSEARREGRLKDVLSQIADEEAKAWVLSCGEEGAYYLLAEDGTLAHGARPLPNRLFKALGRARVGLQPTPHSGSTPSASPAAAPGLCPREGCGKPMGTCGLHYLTCLESGPGGGKGMRSLRHAEVKGALGAAMRRVGGAKMVPMPEPDLCTLWREKEDYRRRRAGAQQPPPPGLPARAACHPCRCQRPYAHGGGRGRGRGGSAHCPARQPALPTLIAAPGGPPRGDRLAWAGSAELAQQAQG